MNQGEHGLGEAEFEVVVDEVLIEQTGATARPRISENRERLPLPALPLKDNFIAEWEAARGFDRVVKVHHGRNGPCVVPPDDRLIIEAGTLLPYRELIEYAADYGWPQRDIVLHIERVSPENPEDRIVCKCTCRSPKEAAAQDDAPGGITIGDVASVVGGIMRVQREESIAGIIEEALSDPNKFKERMEQAQQLVGVGESILTALVDRIVPKVRRRWEEAGKKEAGDAVPKDTARPRGLR